MSVCAISSLCMFDSVECMFDIVCVKVGSGCGSVGRAVDSDTRGPRFDSSHQQNLYGTFGYLFTINCIEKTKIK